MLSCKEAIALASEGMDHKLPFWRRLSLRLHVAMCRHCPPYVRQIQLLERAIRQRYGVDSPPPTTEPLGRNELDRIKSCLRALSADSESANDA